ncbi:MAG: hypothetical protein D6722_12880 [Bacteroidetes bacterium]|nr:MAG: hypothetical protein D6722_12880 [Bacteroidota bacterium]
MLLLLGSLWLPAQTPHGPSERVSDCALCHTSDGWSVALDQVRFDHAETDFALEGMHGQTDCRLCHQSLVFEEAPLSCAECHTDVHSMLVGDDCARCHDANDWLVDNIPELHEENGFPLMGVHATLACVECHLAETNLRFDRIGNECVNCHRDDYEATESPNHRDANYGTDCIECHSPLAFGWEASALSHDFFPLTLGHDIQDCARCHTTGNFSDASPECVQCHQADFNATTNPSHTQLGFSNDCAACHTTDPDWRPAEFRDHDAQFFPIYSGEHRGEWDACDECHQNPANYAEFTCITCHTNPGTDNDHRGISGYVYLSTACLVCHPDGSEDGAFDHNSTGFPLQGQHNGLDCAACHANGFAGTPTDCFACHADDYQATNNPNHSQAQFPTDCAQCHTEDGWTPASFDHDGMYFPIYSGKHRETWDECTICHNNPGNYGDFTCLSCHIDPNTSNKHNGVSGYVYESTACLSCHPTGED